MGTKRGAREDVGSLEHRLEDKVQFAVGAGRSLMLRFLSVREKFHRTCCSYTKGNKCLNQSFLTYTVCSCGKPSGVA